MKVKKAFASVFLAIVVFFMLTITIRAFTRLVLVNKVGMQNAFTNTVLFDLPNLRNDAEPATKQEEELEQTADESIDWSLQYPFSETVLLEIAAEKKQENNHEVNLSAIQLGEKKIKLYTTDYLIWYVPITELANRYETLLQWNYVPYAEYNGVFELQSGYLHTACSRNNVSELVQNTSELSDFCRENGVQFLYINAPLKVCKYEDIGVSGITDFSNMNADEFLMAAEEAGIDCLDLRELLHKEGYNHHEMFYKTDHHWLPETGLWASGKLAEELNVRYGYHFDLSKVEEDQFRKEVYPDWFLGSQGKKVTLERADPEDFTLLYPDYSTSIHYEVQSKRIDKDGDFSIMYNMDRVNERDYYKKNPYGAYFYGDQPLERIVNKDIDEEKRVLILHDSFGNCVVPFLAMGIKYVDSIDLRYFNGSLQAFIEKEKPDTVVVLYNQGEIQPAWSTKIGYLFDFR